MTGGRMMGDGMMDGMGIFLVGFVLVVALLVFCGDRRRHPVGPGAVEAPTGGAERR